MQTTATFDALVAICAELQREKDLRDDAYARGDFQGWRIHRGVVAGITRALAHLEGAGQPTASAAFAAAVLNGYEDDYSDEETT